MKSALEQALAPFCLENKADDFLAYLSLLERWNKTYNLTAVREKEAMILRHIVDSLCIIPWVKGGRLLDVGTGAGLPGLPLALAKPEWFCVLLEANGKRVRFLEEVQRHLKIKNIEIVAQRAEAYNPEQPFDTIVSRAFGSITEMIDKTEHCIAPHGRWLAMKGLYPKEELSLLSCPFQVEQYTLEGLDCRRCCVIVEQKSRGIIP